MNVTQSIVSGWFCFYYLDIVYSYFFQAEFSHQNLPIMGYIMNQSNFILK
jgi:hypothetical protein